MPISRVGDPAQTGPKAPFIRRVKPGASYKAVICGDSAWCCYTHWLPKFGATMPCQAVRDTDGKVIDDTDCEYCRKFLPERWKAYLHVYSYTFEREEFIEMTWRCWSAARAFSVAIPSLRGFELLAIRGNGTKSKLNVTIEAPRPSTSLHKLPREKTPEEALAITMTL